jgi:hypothetical protein
MPEAVMKKLGLCILVFAFLLSTTCVFAEEQWLLVKDKAGVCKIMKTKPDQPPIIGGPYTSKEAALQALKDKCPSQPADKKADDKKPDKKQDKK